MITVLAFLLTIAILVVVHEYGHYLAAKLSGVKVLRFSVGFGRPLLSKRFGRDQTEWVVCAIPLGGYVKMLDEREGDVAAAEAHRAFNRASVWRRMAIVAAGPLANFVLAALVFWVLFVHGVPAVIGAVEKASIAEKAGLQAGDKILAVEDTPVSNWSDFVKQVRSHPGQEIGLLVKTAEETKMLAVTPASIIDNNQSVGRIGAAPTPDARLFIYLGIEEQYSVFPALPIAIVKTWELAILNLQMMGKMVLGEASWRNLSGPVTIADVAGQTVKQGWISYAGFIAIISIGLGVLNLLPIPLLDGGHLVYYIVEVFSGRLVSEKVMEIGARAGMAIIGALILMSLYNDLLRLMNG